MQQQWGAFIHRFSRRRGRIQIVQGTQGQSQSGLRGRPSGIEEEGSSNLLVSQVSMLHEMTERAVKQTSAAGPGNGQIRWPRRKAEKGAGSNGKHWSNSRGMPDTGSRETPTGKRREMES